MQVGKNKRKEKKILKPKFQTKEDLRKIIQTINQIPDYDSDKVLDKLMERLSDNYSHYNKRVKRDGVENYITETCSELWTFTLDQKYTEEEFIDFAEETIGKKLLKFYAETWTGYILSTFSEDGISDREEIKEIYGNDLTKSWINLTTNLVTTRKNLLDIIEKSKKLHEESFMQKDSTQDIFSNKQIFYLKLNAVIKYLLREPSNRQRTVLREVYSIHSKISRNLIWDYYECYTQTSSSSHEYNYGGYSKGFKGKYKKKDKLYGPLLEETDNIIKIIIESIKEGALKFSDENQEAWRMLDISMLENLNNRIKDQHHPKILEFKNKLDSSIEDLCTSYISLIDKDETREKIHKLLNLEGFTGWEKIKHHFQKKYSDYRTAITEGVKVEYKAGYTFDENRPTSIAQLKSAKTKVEKKKVMKVLQEKAAFRIWSTLAAFLNTDGGTLIIGVPNDRSLPISGMIIEDELKKLQKVYPNDFKKKLKKENFEDFLSQHLDNLLFNNKKNHQGNPHYFDDVKNYISHYSTVIPQSVRNARQPQKILYVFQVKPRPGGGFELYDPEEENERFFVRENEKTIGKSYYEYNEWNKIREIF